MRIIACDACKKKFKVPREKIPAKGANIRCPKCSAPIRVPGEAEVAKGAGGSGEFGEAPFDEDSDDKTTVASADQIDYARSVSGLDLPKAPKFQFTEGRKAEAEPQPTFDDPVKALGASKFAFEPPTDVLGFEEPLPENASERLKALEASKFAFDER